MLHQQVVHGGGHRDHTQLRLDFKMSTTPRQSLHLKAIAQ